MCTLTYLPTQEGFLFTSNRDESTARERAVFPHYSESNSQGKLLMPLDPQGGGTWILATEHGEAACLLNGAFVKHKHKPPYKKSRGRVIVESFNFERVSDFLSHYDFEGIEPFSLIKVVQEDGIRKIFDIRWDEKDILAQEVDSRQPRIWSSVTLYDDAMRAKREEWFQEWLGQHNTFHAANILNFHQNGGEGDPTVDFKMTRSGGLQTISISCIEMKTNEAEIAYHSLLTQQKQTEKMPLCSLCK